MSDLTMTILTATDDLPGVAAGDQFAKIMDSADGAAAIIALNRAAAAALEHDDEDVRAETLRHAENVMADLRATA